MGGDRNQLETLLGIGTMVFLKSQVFNYADRNQLETLLGIETYFNIALTTRIRSKSIGNPFRD